MLDYDAAMLLKKKHLKRIAAWGEANFMQINWNLFYDTFMILIR